MTPKPEVTVTMREAGAQFIHLAHEVIVNDQILTVTRYGKPLVQVVRHPECKKPVLRGE